MGIFLMFCGVISVLVSIWALTSGNDLIEEGLFVFCCGVLMTMGVVAFGLGCVFYFQEPEPELLDVYRGNTELVIHYEQRGDSLIPVDSVVVFKEQ